MLNLAKAELLMSHPAQIIGQRIHHGLSFNPTRGKTIAGDVLRLNAGVFPLLYEKRTGQQLPLTEKLEVKRLLANCPELMDELDETGIGKATFSNVMYAAVRDAQECWSVLALDRPEDLGTGTPSRRLLDRFYLAIDPPQLWQELFAVSPRLPTVGNLHFFEQRTKYPLSGTIQDIATRTWTELSEILDYSTHEAYDALMCPSLYKSRMFSMPASLARYALMFYVSSLVRYKPSQLDPQSNGRQAWLLDSFTNEASLLLLRAALSNITQRNHVFYSPSSFRK
jgi:YaaC-like protein